MVKHEPNLDKSDSGKEAEELESRIDDDGSPIVGATCGNGISRQN